MWSTTLLPHPSTIFPAARVSNNLRCRYTMLACSVARLSRQAACRERETSSHAGIAPPLAPPPPAKLRCEHVNSEGVQAVHSSLHAFANRASYGHNNSSQRHVLALQVQAITSVTLVRSALNTKHTRIVSCSESTSYSSMRPPSGTAVTSVARQANRPSLCRRAGGQSARNFHITSLAQGALPTA